MTDVRSAEDPIVTLVEGRLYFPNQYRLDGRVCTHPLDLRGMAPPLRLLPTNWLYDQKTRIMLTSHLFTYMWRRPGPEGPLVVDSTEPKLSDDQVRSFMVGDSPSMQHAVCGPGEE
jgi:hypothetical protein